MAEKLVFDASKEFEVNGLGAARFNPTRSQRIPPLFEGRRGAARPGREYMAARRRRPGRWARTALPARARR